MPSAARGAKQSHDRAISLLGGYPQPSGRVPRGCTWDYVSRAPGDTQMVRSAPFSDDVADERNSVTIARSPSSVAILSQVSGRVPRGCTWDYVSGAWRYADGTQPMKGVRYTP